ncbi:MAG: PKD domain-containing protein [Bacteroidetes bacterium]|nr:PKD domain-containing protein [Bacteroidota bacterium]
MKNQKFKLTQWLLIAIMSFWANQNLNAQCIPPSILSSSLCANSPIQFKMQAVGATNVVWDFNGTKDNSGNPTPSFSFNSPGTYNVTLSYTDAAGNPCSQTIQITILPPPTLDINIITPTVQCFAGNKFTLVDNSKAAPGSFIKRVKYVAAGLQVDQNNPTMPFSFDFSTADPGGNFYSIDVEIEDANGCIVVKRFANIVEVKPSLGLNFTSDKPKGCDSTLMTITNNSLINPNAISSFKWDFGDGNTDETNWGPTVKHMYYLEGPDQGAFKACLTVTDTTGCTETFCFDASAVNLLVGGKIVPDKDSACMADNPINFELVPGLPTGASGFLWTFGDPDTGPMNFDNKNPLTSKHDFSKPGPFLVSYTYFHPICGSRAIYKQVAMLGPASSIPGPKIPIDERYQCEAKKPVHFPNESKFFHNDTKFFNDARGYFEDDSLNMWIYHFDSTTLTLSPEKDSLPNRGKDCVFRIWDFDDDYAPRCTTNTVAGINVGVNCKWSMDSLPVHTYTDWDTIYYDSFYLPNKPFDKTIIVSDPPTPGCYRISVDTTDKEEHRRLFYQEIPRCYNVKLYHKDTCHEPFCESQATTQISIMKPNAAGVRKEGRYCFGGPPNYGVTFNLDPGTKPGCTTTEVYINPDTALHNIDSSSSWIPYLPGGMTGTYQSPSPIMPYPMSGPYPNKLFLAYPNPKSIKDTLTGYATVGFIIGNGSPANCYDTVYYDSFLKFPVIDPDVEIVIPAPMTPTTPNLFKVCRGDSLVMRVSKSNITVPYDADQITYSFRRFAPSDVEENGRYPFYSYEVVENYEWFVPQNGGTYLENFLNREVLRTYGPTTQSLKKERFSIGTVEKWIALADVSQIFDQIEPAFESLGFDLATMSDEDIAKVFQLKCIDTTGLGRYITWSILPLQRTSTHYRDTSIFSLDQYDNSPADYEKNAYTFIAEENGIFNFDFTIRSRIGGCIMQNLNRVIVGFYNKLEVTDSIICKDTEIEGTPTFRYFHVDPDNNVPSPCGMPTWMDCTDYWTIREPQAGQPKIEGFTKWDWSKDDDNITDPNTIFAPNNSGTNPYGTYSYSPVILGGNGSNKIYYLDSGIYTLRVAASDSTGCPDTLYQNIYVTRLDANFGFKDTLNACVNIVTLFDSTILTDPCVRQLGTPCDEIIEWYIDWGDDKQPDLFNKNTYPPYLGFNIGHNYTRAGTFEVLLKVKTELGCEDSIRKTFVIAGPIPEFTTDKLEVCSGDSITFYNKSSRITGHSEWVWRFGDGFTKSEKAPNQLDSFKHEFRYNGAGADTTYYAYLTMFDSVSGRFCGFTYPDTVGNSQPKYAIKVIGKSVVTLTADKDTICPGDIVEFKVNGDLDYISYFWNFDAERGNSDTLTSPDTIQRKQFFGVGTFMITTSGNMDPNILKCPDADTLYVFVDSVKADFEIDSTKMPDYCFKNTSLNSVKSRWGFYHTTDITQGGGEPFKEVIESNDEKVCNNFVDSLGTWYVCLIVENAGGCIDTVCKEISFFRKIHVPNVYTPPTEGKTGDGLNDVFDIPINGHDLYELTIRNRWGDVVFKSDDDKIDWNGKVNNTGAICPDGQYIYQLKYKFKGMEEESVSGIVVLIREK